MSLKDLKVTDEEFSSYGVISQPDTLTGTPEENKAVFDALIRRVSIEHINKLIDELSTSGAADMGTEPFGAVTATTVQAALEQIYALIGSTYSGTDGAGKVGFSGTSSIQASTGQAAIEAVQANLAALITLLKSQQGAAQVGNAPIAGLTATTVQAALAELRDQIQDIVAGSIPSQSVTTEQIQDGAVTAEKIGFTGEDIPTSDTDSTSISSQLSNKVNAVIENVSTEDSLIDYVNDNQIGFFTDWAGVTPGAFSSGLFVRGLDQDNASIIGVDDDGIPYFGGVKIKNRTVSYKTGATATPPQEFDLPLAEGVSAVSSAYWKDQFGVVTGHFNVLISSSQTGSSPVIATLPEGFRPSRQANATAVVSSGESLGLLVLVTGEIQLQDAASVTLEGKYIKGLFSFVAAT